MKLFFRIIIVIGFFSLLSCTKESQTNTDRVVQDSIPKNEKKIVNSIGEVLFPKAQKLISKWDDYKELDAMMTRYYAVSKSDAYYNADELVLLAKQIKDSIKVPTLEIDAMKLRLNVLHNEALRLKDMTGISNISKKELTAQIKNIIAAFSAVNSKINEVVSVANLEVKMKDFDSAMLEAFSKEKEQEPEKTVMKKPTLPQKRIPLSKRKKMLSKKRLKNMKILNK